MVQLHPRFRLRIALITAVWLLFAQFGAMTHAYSHAPGAVPTAAQQQLPASHDSCNDCLNFAPVLTSAGAPVAMFIGLSPDRGSKAVVPFSSLVGHRPPLAFRSRAPPVGH